MLNHRKFEEKLAMLLPQAVRLEEIGGRTADNHDKTLEELDEVVEAIDAIVRDLRGQAGAETHTPLPKRHAPI